MRLVKDPLLSAFPNRILNIHPSLLPMYPGRAAWKQALDDKAEVTGCTVHYVDDGIDTGEVLGNSTPFQNLALRSSPCGESNRNTSQNHDLIYAPHKCEKSQASDD